MSFEVAYRLMVIDAAAGVSHPLPRQDASANYVTDTCGIVFVVAGAQNYACSRLLSTAAQRRRRLL